MALKKKASLLTKYKTALDGLETIHFAGKVTRVTGQLIEADGPQSVVGECCKIRLFDESQISCEVVGFNSDKVQLMAYDNIEGIEKGCEVIATGAPLSVGVSDSLLGRVIDSQGLPMDGKGPIVAKSYASIFNKPPHVMNRQPITKRLLTGIRAIDFMTPVAKGQRMGIFSGSGVGKSTLMGMIARNTNADINVIALIGERGREVLDMVRRDLGEEGLARSVVVVSTSDTPALARVRGAYVAMAIAEYFRDQGKDVMMLFDSVTRLAMAQREIGLAIGEPSATKGYTPSVSVVLQKLLERCGTSLVGSITGFFTVLVEADDMDDYVVDTVRGIIDGHIVLNRQLANSYHYPAIDVLASLSRLTSSVSSKEEQRGAGKLRQLISLYREKEDLINVGAYSPGSNFLLDEAVNKINAINSFLQQGEFEQEPYIVTLKKAGYLVGQDYRALGTSYQTDINNPSEWDEIDVGSIAQTVYAPQGVAPVQNGQLANSYQAAALASAQMNSDRARIQFQAPATLAQGRA